jgi:hypothetical protein
VLQAAIATTIANPNKTNRQAFNTRRINRILTLTPVTSNLETDCAHQWQSAISVIANSVDRRGNPYIS